MICEKVAGDYDDTVHKEKKKHPGPSWLLQVGLSCFPLDEQKDHN